jgi:hypothetical protein
VGDFFFKKREILEFAMNKEESFDIKKRKISLICENTLILRKIFVSSHVCINDNNLNIKDIKVIYYL